MKNLKWITLLVLVSLAQKLSAQSTTVIEKGGEIVVKQNSLTTSYERNFLMEFGLSKFDDENIILINIVLDKDANQKIYFYMNGKPLNNNKFFLKLENYIAYRTINLFKNNTTKCYNIIFNLYKPFFDEEGALEICERRIKKLYFNGVEVDEHIFSREISSKLTTQTKIND